MDMPAIFSGITPGDGLFQYENDGLDMEATIVKKWIHGVMIMWHCDYITAKGKRFHESLLRNTDS